MTNQNTIIVMLNPSIIFQIMIEMEIINSGSENNYYLEINNASKNHAGFRREEPENSPLSFTLGEKNYLV